LDTVLALAKEIEVSPTEIAISWLLHKARRSTTALIAILGSRTREQLAGTLCALNVNLSPAQIAQLDETSATPLGTPHEQIRASLASIAGGQAESLDLPALPVT